MKDGLYQILFVCTGNICRSPMAEGILRARLSHRAAEFASVRSAGAAAAPGLPASAHAVTVCRENRIDISGHRSRPVSPVLLEEADLILVMEEHHRQAICRMTPEAADRTFLVSEYAAGDPPGGAREVPDPIGQDLEVYRSVFETLVNYANRALPRIEASIAAAGKSA